jgi:hypothetical protein
VLLRPCATSMAAALSIKLWLTCGGPSSLSSDMCLTGTLERAGGAVGSACAKLRPGPRPGSSLGLCRSGPEGTAASGSMRSSATAVQSSIVTGLGGTGGAAILCWGPRCACPACTPARHNCPPPHLEYCCGNRRIYELLPGWCELAPRSRPGLRLAHARHFSHVGFHLVAKTLRSRWRQRRTTQRLRIPLSCILNFDHVIGTR